VYPKEKSDLAAKARIVSSSAAQAAAHAGVRRLSRADVRRSADKRRGARAAERPSG
jgi:hypothetical protein